MVSEHGTRDVRETAVGFWGLGLAARDKKSCVSAVFLGVARVSWAMEISIGLSSGSVSVKLYHAATKEQLRKTTTTFNIFLIDQTSGICRSQSIFKNCRKYR